jgi:hypothetical protein
VPRCSFSSKGCCHFLGNDLQGRHGMTCESTAQGVSQTNVPIKAFWH